MRNLHLIAMIGLIASVGLVLPAAAGTCMPVKAKGLDKNVIKATALAQSNLLAKAKSLGGKITQATTNCVPGPAGTLCKISAVVCPK